MRIDRVDLPVFTEPAPEGSSNRQSPRLLNARVGYTANVMIHRTLGPFKPTVSLFVPSNSGPFESS